MHFYGSMGRITDYIKNILLEQKWQLRKIEISAAKSKDGELENIKSKMKSGRRLSYDEKEFLRVHALDLEKALKIENERDEFRHELENCKTKEEAKRIRTSKSLELQIEALAMNDSEFIVIRIMSIFDEFADFMKSEEYACIPSEYEEDENMENGGKFKLKKAKSAEPDLIPGFKAVLKSA